MIVDSHCHLDFDDFNADRDAVMARARQAGIGVLLTIGIRVRQFERVLAIAERYPHVYCSVGTLPHFSDEERDVTAAELVNLARHPKVVGIGEAGLDRFYGNASWDAQIEVFQAHIEASRQTQLPLIIHSVREDEAMADMLIRETKKGTFPIVMHCFSGGPALAETALSLGAYVSFSGLLTYPENAALRDIAATIPDDKLLVETDAPSQVPVPLLEERNEPAFILKTIDVLAIARNTRPEIVMRQTASNFFSAFAKVSQRLIM
ncbi:YchF/TatD family DNA exonuclease [Agrobacterium vitis]|uniref:TatD family deoxyribonuclease n=1 Tax=Agrobacterium vitis TaxID=373 RepID=A0A368NL61_AGRVI|nr:TatD family hydrolase [Agrobacterium vitis]KAA3506288.1 TatD family deoxyribonuclease [Agrobacterium vitis]KAA3520704.1 TatD family deoxyribonuclease [Agrobacterium vitis]MCF1480257.1 TatD family deoxyribonuclease [Agrobacterium vitis]MUZ99624.1 YchF/TatD family DNA exonuclease [Agrobacterium vitis]MVA32396.1 YchF/TatD family DNA exonuclease [Agrobacterium vitis]